MNKQEALTELLSIIAENIEEANKVLAFIKDDIETMSKILAAEPVRSNAGLEV